MERRSIRERQVQERKEEKERGRATGMGEEEEEEAPPEKLRAVEVDVKGLELSELSKGLERTADLGLPLRCMAGVRGRYPCAVMARIAERRRRGEQRITFVVCH